MMSSPDPLNDSLTFHSPPKPRRSSRALQSLPPQRNSPKKQTFQLDVGNQLSPQKLRVTVEAEGSDAENEYAVPSSPTRKTANRRRERTTTTTIPVKGLSDSEETQVISPKKGRGRPRKSATPVASNKGRRAGTPTQKSNGRRKSIGSLVDGDDDDDIDFRIGEGVEIGRGKGRSRSRSTKGASRKSTPAAAKQTELPSQLASSATTKKGRSRKKSVLPVEVSEADDKPDLESYGEDIQPDFGDEDESNRYLSPSTYPTIRSSTTVEEDRPDILLARFEPGDEIPHRPGWSSPRVLSTQQPPSSRSRTNMYPSPLTSPDKATFSPVEDDNLPSGLASQSEYPDHMSGDLENNEDNDQVDGMPEFDTILESEGFSMISVDSVPSLREHLSSPTNVPEKQLNNSTKKDLQEIPQGEYEDSFSAVPEDILLAATPARKPQSNPLSTQQTQIDNPSSNIRPRVLSGATFVKKTLATKLLSRQSSRQSLVDNSFSSIDQDILEAATPAKPLLKKIVSNQGLQRDYEDSFSTISNEVLEAATPAPAVATRPSEDNLTLPNQQSTVPQSMGSSPSRLLTPDETPSPSEEDPHTGKPQPTHEKLSATQDLNNDSSFVHSQLPSSPPPIAPPRFTYTAHIRQHRQLNPNAETPSILFSSPSLPPPILGGRGQAVITQATPRPPLSPIARTGQVLQNITVPSSSRSRSQSLGSPFKSPVAERKSSSILAEGSHPPPMQDRLAGPLPKLDLNSHFGSQYSQQRKDDDPFSTISEGERSPFPEQKNCYTLDLPRRRRYSDPRLDNLKAIADTVRSDDAMSWQAEEETSIETANSTRANAGTQQLYPKLTAEQRWDAERAAVSKQISQANSKDVIVIGSDDENSKHYQEEGDEDFGLLLETLNSSSPVAQKEREPISDINERPRRGKIPSPWRKNSKKLIYSDELARLSSPAVVGKSIFRGNIGNEVSSQPITVRRVVPTEPSPDVDADLSGWQIPQKSNFKPRARENTDLDLSALLAASPMKSLPTLSGTSGGFSRPQSISEKPTLFQTSYVNSIQKDSSQPLGFTPIPQKAGFNPRPRADSSSPIKQNSFQPSIFGRPAEERSSNSNEPISTSSGSKPLSQSSTKRPNMPLAQRLVADQLSPSFSDDLHSSFISNKEKENIATTNSRTQKWTESIKLATASTITPTSASPAKSCLRSPLKTPSANSAEQTPNKGVTFVSSSPIPSSPPEAAQLSATEWSKAHWLLLESITQSWKLENESCQPSSSSRTDGSGESREGSRKLKRRNSTRVISKLLGRKVFSGPDEMRLEQWHLEAVDEFRGIVPGWEEKVIAMRVFALCIGEKQRAEKARKEAEAAAAG